MNKRIAFFDFDGTITTKDAFISFLKYSVPFYKYYFNLLLASPVLGLFLCKFINNEEAKQYLFSIFFKGYKLQGFKKLTIQFEEELLPSILNPKALDKIQWHKNREHEIVVVSANFDLLLSGWCKKQNIKLIATCIETNNGIITGKFDTKNCYGIEKVNRIRALYNLDSYDEIFAYGDSRGDKELLEMAHRRFFKSF